ncbi:MAG TPA: hypothetical protein VNP37_19025, partial [Actinomycetospora sp.]|nr:hypothetical protein [Actinomycetospora sp.]
GAFLAVPVAAVLAEILRYLGERIDAHAGETPDPDGGADADDLATDGASTVPTGGRPSDVTSSSSTAPDPADPAPRGSADTRAARATGAAGAAVPGVEDRSVGGG